MNDDQKFRLLRILIICATIISISALSILGDAISSH